MREIKIRPIGRITPVSLSDNGEEQPKPVGKITPVGNTNVLEPLSQGHELSTLIDDRTQKLNDKIEALDFIGGVNDDEKKYLKTIAPYVDETKLDDAIKTVSGEHPLQEGFQTWYKSPETGLPIPLKPGEKPPKSVNVESVWGSQQSADDDHPLTTISKNLLNSIPQFIGAIEDVGAMGQTFVTGKEPEWYKSGKERLKALEANTSAKSNEALFNTEGVKSFKDILDPSRFNFTTDNVAGNISQAASSILQFVAANALTGGLGTVAEGAVLSEKAALTAKQVLASATINMGDVLDMAEAAGLKDREKFMYGSLVSLPLAFIEMNLGLSGKILGNEAAQTEKELIGRQVLKKLQRDEAGNITQKGIDEAYKEVMSLGTIYGKRYAAKLAGTAAGEATEEVAQQLTQNASAEIYDKLFGEGHAIGEGKFGKEAFSPESFGEMINSGIGGLLAGGGGHIAMKQKQNEQSQSAYEAVIRGDEHVSGLKAELARAKDNGTITQNDYDLANQKINTFGKYNKQVENVGVQLDNTQKKRVFDLTWSNENLKAQIDNLQLDPDSKIEGTIPHAALRDTQKILRANSDEISAITGKSIESQQRAIADKLKEEKQPKEKAVKKRTKSVQKESAGDKHDALLGQIQTATTEKDLDAFLKEADEKGLSTPDLVDVIAQKRKEINPSIVSKEKVITPLEEEVIPEQQNKQEHAIAISHKEISDKLRATKSKITPGIVVDRGKLYNNQLGVMVNVNGKEVVHPITSSAINVGKHGVVSRVRVGNKVALKLVPKEEWNPEGKVMNKEGVPYGDKIEIRTMDKGNKHLLGHLQVTNFHTAKQLTLAQPTHKLLVVHHGDTAEDKAGKISGTTDIPLNEEGKQASNKAADQIKKEGITKIYTSPTERAAETSKRVAAKVKGLTIKGVKGFDVWDIGDYVQQKDEVFPKKYFVDNFDATEYTDKKGKVWKIGESFNTFKNRNIKAYNAIAAKNEKGSAIVTHGENIKLFNALQTNNGVWDKKAREDFINAGKVGNAEIINVKSKTETNNNIENKNRIISFDSPEKLKGYKPDEIMHFNQGVDNNRVTLITDPSIKSDYSKESSRWKGFSGGSTSGFKHILKDITKKFRDGYAKDVIVDLRGIDLTQPLNTIINQLKTETDVQIGSTKEVLQRKQGGTGKEGSERGGVEQGKQGKTSTKKSEEKIKEEDFSKGKTSEQKATEQNIDFNEEEEAMRHIAYESENPLELAIYYLKLENQPKKENEKNKIIRESNIFINNKDFDKYIDKNEKSKTVAKRFIREKAQPLDVTAQEISTPEIEITTQDIADYIKNESLGNETKGQSLQSAFKQTFERLTGKDLTPKLARTIVAREEKRDYQNYEEAINKATEIEGKKTEQAQKGYEKDIAKGKIVPQEQKKSTRSQKNIDKIIAQLQKSIPKATIIYDKNLKSAGQLSADGKTITINPDYAGLDTPIHEYGHILIDALGGTKNALINQGVNQLKESTLWADTKTLYPELDEDMLAKEVLAEAIGREGAKLFTDQSKQNKFVSWLSGLFYKLKSALGIDKNIAKKLASQLLSKKDLNITPEPTEQTQEQKIKASEEVNEDLHDEPKEKKSKSLAERKQVVIEQILNAKKFHGLSKANIKDVGDLLKLYKEKDLEELSLKDLKSLHANIIAAIGIAKIREKHPEFDYTIIPRKDISIVDIYMKALSDFSESHPEMQELARSFNEHFENSVEEKQKALQEIVAVEEKIIREYNKQHGILQAAKNYLNPFVDNSQYYNFVVGKNGVIEKGSEGYNKLTDIQKEFIDTYTKYKKKFKNLASEEIFGEEGIIKVNKTFDEFYHKSDAGILNAYLLYSSEVSEVIDGVRMYYTNTKGQIEKLPFSEIKQRIADQSNKNIISKVKAIYELTRYKKKATELIGNKQHEGEPIGSYDVTENGQFNISNGKIRSKFNKSFSNSREYSGDHGMALREFVKDMTFIENIQPVIPMIESIEHFNKLFGKEREHLTKWLDIWKKGVILKTPQESLGKGIDATMKFMRRWTQLRIMAFNIPAGAFNVLIGKYNNYRGSSLKVNKTGDIRYTKDFKKSQAVAKRYRLVSLEENEAPEKHIGKLFNLLAFGMTQAGENYIQTSGTIGQMTDTEWNWLDKEGNVTGKDAKEVKEREAILRKQFIVYKKNIADIQGKYSENEKRNFSHFELGRMLMQFKTWMPDTIRDRFAKRYININGDVKEGTLASLQRQGIKDIIQQMKDPKFFTSNDPEYVLLRRNLRSAMAMTTLFALWLGSSDDDDNKEYADVLHKAIIDMSFVMNTDQLSFLAGTPAASLGTITEALKVINAVITLEEYKSSGKGHEAGELKAFNTGTKLLPYGKFIQIGEKLMPDEE